MAAIAPQGFAELPICPVCFERLNQNTTSVGDTLCDHLFGCLCISSWTHMSCQVCRLCRSEDVKRDCEVCGTCDIPWICLICSFVGCGRLEKGHAIKHWSETQHNFIFQPDTWTIWDYIRGTEVERSSQSYVVVIDDEFKSQVSDVNVSDATSTSSSMEEKN